MHNKVMKNLLYLCMSQKHLIISETNYRFNLFYLYKILIDIIDIRNGVLNNFVVIMSRLCLIEEYIITVSF